MSPGKRMTKRCVSGILLLDKPPTMSSNRALQVVKRLYSARKAGHTGSLDPLASGLLPICFGDATKFSQYLLNADKTYIVTMRLGIRTDTGDTEGSVVCERPVPTIDMAMVDTLFNRFRGEIEQTPPMYSALKHEGQPLYKLARKGITVHRQVRRLTVYRLTLLAIAQNRVYFELHCSKGAYVRTLVDDFGEALGCGAHVTELRRVSIGAFSSQQMISLAALQHELEATSLETLDRHLLPPQASLAHWPQISVSESLAFYLRQGRPVFVSHAPTSGWVCLLHKQNQFFGIGEVQEDGRIAPRRLCSQA